MLVKIAIIISEFNHEITGKMEDELLRYLKEKEISKDNYIIVKVPGAVELPIIAKQLALTKKYQAIIVMGAVIRGETSHYDYVCSQVSYGVQKIAIEQMIPVIFGLLTCENDEQAYARIGGSMGNKPRECLDAAIAMISIMSKIDET